MIELDNTPPSDEADRAILDGLLRRDAALWSTDPGVQRAIENRLGWIDAAGFMDRHADAITAFAAGIRGEGYQQAVLLGMGGSSLAPEVYASVYSGASERLYVTVVDSTSPEHVRAMTDRCEGVKTLFIVSSKSGTTAETSALDAHFHEWARARLEQPSSHFVAITDAGSPLESLAAQRGYRHTFINPSDIGGRFSALSYFGLVPAALAGADLRALRAALPDDPGGSPLLSDACRLGRCLGMLALAGRNKLTLQPGPGLEPVAAWIEQLIDESTGKHGQGILAVPDEPLLEPSVYGRDRVFAVIDHGGARIDDHWARQVRDHGHPLMRWSVDGPDRLGAEFYRWEAATAVAGRELGINPFDEPDVNDSKARTRTLLEQPAAEPPAGAATPEAIPGFLEQAREGDYIAILAYLPPTRGTLATLRQWSHRLARHGRLPCCLGIGPRYLHSSGQLHKGGPDQGLFIVVTRDPGVDIPIPGQHHGFRSLIRAQAHGDLQVLRERGRRVLHVGLEDGASLEDLVRGFP